MSDERIPFSRDVRITDPSSWIFLALLGVLLAIAVAWSIFGSIDRTALGSGLILRDHRFGIMDIESTGSGPIKSINVKIGDIVAEGDAVAELDLALGREQSDAAKTLLESLISQDRRLDLEEQDRLRVLQAKIQNQTELFEKGLITRAPLLDTKASIEAIHQRAMHRELLILRQQGTSDQGHLRHNFESILRSDHAGRVVEIVGVEGDYVTVGKTIARLESLSGTFEALIYIPAQEGKKVHVGMDVRIAPSTVRPEEFGHISGRVRTVSAFPVTKENVVRALRNDHLVENLLQGGSAIEVVVSLDSDPQSPTGFRWNSRRSPDLKIESGTLCKATIVLRRERPISLVIPFLKRFFQAPAPHPPKV